jgi:predicted MarR family transcription regulator
MATVAIVFRKQLANGGKIVSIDKVKSEIYRSNDALKQWCINNLPAAFFQDTTHVMAEYAQVANWVASRSNHYLPKAVTEFLDADEADAHIVAYALADAHNRVVVTQEISQPNRINKVKIPEACNALNIQYLNTINMFRRLGERF